MRWRKNLIAGLVTLLVVICCATAWAFFRTKTNVRASSPLHSPICRMWREGGWAQSPIKKEIVQLILSEIAVGDARETVEAHIKTHFRSYSFREERPMMPPFDPFYSIIAVHNQELVSLSEIRIRYWFRTNHLLKVDVDPYVAAL
jgi:hypothetical protein